MYVAEQSTQILQLSALPGCWYGAWHCHSEGESFLSSLVLPLAIFIFTFFSVSTEQAEMTVYPNSRIFTWTAPLLSQKMEHMIFPLDS